MSYLACVVEGGVVWARRLFAFAQAIDVIRRVEFDAQDEITRYAIVLAYGPCNLVQELQCMLWGAILVRTVVRL